MNLRELRECLEKYSKHYDDREIQFYMVDPKSSENIPMDILFIAGYGMFLGVQIGLK